LKIDHKLLNHLAGKTDRAEKSKALDAVMVEFQKRGPFKSVPARPKLKRQVEPKVEPERILILTPPLILEVPERQS